MVFVLLLLYVPVSSVLFEYYISTVINNRRRNQTTGTVKCFYIKHDLINILFGQNDCIVENYYYYIGKYIQYRFKSLKHLVVTRIIFVIFRKRA